MGEKYDFSGWATRNDIRCSDGRIIRRDAFKDCDGVTVPLVWNHRHNEPFNVLGHALLKNEPEGVRAYGYLNDTEAGEYARSQILHGDIRALSIYANKLKQNGHDVVHGMIREVSLVLAGANPGAFIDDIAMAHSEDGSEYADEVIIYSGEEFDEMVHSEEEETPAEELEHAEESKEEAKEVAEEKTIKDVFDTLNEEQKTVVYALIGQAVENAKKGGNSDEGEDEVKHNAFSDEYEQDDEVLAHAEIMEAIGDGKRYGSMKESFLAHGIDDVEWLFPEAKRLDNGAPDFIKRPDEWVSVVMNGVHHSPFSRIKSMFADITEEDARARGYIKGKMKKEEFFGLMKRTTTPTTIYKKQKMDRDDVIDITEFDVIAWLKVEMRMMLDEELARAFLIGDGRDASSDDKINEQNIRPIYKDASLFTVRKRVQFANNATTEDKCKAIIKAAIKARKDYRGSGNPILFMTEDWVTDMLLLEDGFGHALYEDEAKLAKKMRVSRIVTVPVMEGVQDDDGRDLYGIIVNLNDYNVGADKGGAVNMFDDFDIDYNAMKYLIETRCSGALVKPFSAIVLEAALNANDASTDTSARGGVEVSTH